MAKLTPGEYYAIMLRVNSAIYAQARGDCDMVAEQFTALSNYVASLATS